MEKFILMDGNSIANRAFYALPMLSNSSGLYTHAVYGFTTMLMKLLEEEKPTHFLVAFDAGKITFRHQDFKDYKGKRDKTPAELSEQFPHIKEVLRAFGIAQVELPGYEADDIIGTVARMAEAKGKKVVIVTGDKDMLQLVSENVSVALTKKGISELQMYDPGQIREQYGLTPQQIIDLKGLMGDTSDNIPGIPGVGEKTALKLLHQYGSVEGVLLHAEELTGKLKEKVMQHAEDARMSKQLATIFCEVPLDLTLDDLKHEGYDPRKVREVFQKLEFKSLLEKVNLSGGTIEGGTSQAETTPVKALEAVVVTEDNLGRLLSRLDQIKALYVEVIGENPHESDVLGISLYGGPEAYFVPFPMLVSEKAEPIRKWLSDETKEKWIYDLHRAEVAFYWKGIALKGVTFDVLLAAYLLNPTEMSLTLGSLAKKYGVAGVREDDEVYGKGAKFSVPDIKVLSGHLCQKAAAVHELVPVLDKELGKDGMSSLYYDLEHPLAQVLAKMEKQGIKVDRDDLIRYGEELNDELEQLMKKIYALAGTTFNLNSPKQLGEILFDKLGLPVVKKTKTGYSTDAEVLEKLAPYHEIVGNILHYRLLAKLQSTYVEGLLKEIRSDTGKVHTYYRQTIVATGRLSSQFPNLQNIPIRMEEGRKIRKVFVPSEPGWYILSADYSQIELRVLAHISGDERLKEAFRENMDIHTKTAMDVFGVPESQVDANMRRQAKAVNFGIVYGISDYGLSQSLNISRKAAAEFIERYFSVFRGVRKFMDDIVRQAQKNGYVTTLLHRRRYLPDINSSNYNKRSFAERTAMNTPIQGTAADIIKLAMVRMDERLAQEGLKSRMLLQVHDELVFEVPENELEMMLQLVPEVMENALPLDVPLKVEVSYGRNWYEAK